MRLKVVVSVFGPDEQKTKEQLALEHERAIEEERARAEQIEEQRSVAELRNELLTEMVAAEQVMVSVFFSAHNTAPYIGVDVRRSSLWLVIGV